MAAEEVLEAWERCARLNLGFRVLGFRGLGFRVESLGFRVLGFRV